MGRPLSQGCASLYDFILCWSTFRGKQNLQPSDQCHKRFEKNLPVCSIVCRRVNTSGWILNLGRSQQSAPPTIIVVQSHAGVANIHPCGIPCIPTNWIRLPRFRIFVISKNLQVKAWSQTVAKAKEGLKWKARCGDVRSLTWLRTTRATTSAKAAATATLFTLATCPLLKVLRYPERVAFASVGCAKCILVHVQKDINTLLLKCLHYSFQLCGKLRIHRGSPSGQCGFHKSRQAHTGYHRSCCSILRWWGCIGHGLSSGEHSLSIGTYHFQGRIIRLCLHHIVPTHEDHFLPIDLVDLPINAGTTPHGCIRNGRRFLREKAAGPRKRSQLVLTTCSISIKYKQWVVCLCGWTPGKKPAFQECLYPYHHLLTAHFPVESWSKNP